MKLPLIIVTGPTAVGKTALSLKLAHAADGEIISADSVQVYRGMDIGSAKIRPQEMQGVRHHLIDILDPDEPFDVVRFQHLAKAAVRKIVDRGHIPIIAGGTGFYIQALLKDVCFEKEDGSDAYRRSLEEIAASGDGDLLYKRLQAVDPQSAKIIHPHNHKRIIRALEFYEKNGYPISAHNAQQKERSSPYRYVYFVLTQERAVLYERINRRTEEMLREGLVEEVRALRDAGYGRELTSMQAIGYKEIMAYLDGEYTIEEAAEQIRLHTRHFAKRQITWFKREQDVILLEKERFSDEDAILNEMLSICRRQGILPQNALRNTD